LYASDAFGYNDVNAAHMATVSFWMRPAAAVVAGFLGDRLIHSKIIRYCFLIMLSGSIIISLGILKAEMTMFIIISIASTSAGIYGLRGLYYALFQESNLPIVYTGSAAGLVSVVGYTPDIFMGPLMGVILDNNPGATGHQYLFMVLAGFSIIGYIATVLFRKSVKK
jgi:sugar phosphate permease